MAKKLKFLGHLESKFFEKANFYLAFDKLKVFFEQGNEWYDTCKMRDYEANLEDNILRLRKEINLGDYIPKEISPLPFPKSNNTDGNQRLRPYFEIQIDDQLIWIAIVNVIGPKLDCYIPSWSYGNRLYNPVWFEEKDGDKVMKSGSYPKTSSKIYKNWNQSWPLYRQHISNTIISMSNPSMYVKERIPRYLKTINIKGELRRTISEFQIYFFPNFFGKRKVEKLFWMGLDFEKFFPSINKEIIQKNIKYFLENKNFASRDDTKDITSLIRRMLKFPLNIEEAWSQNNLGEKYGFCLKRSDYYEGIPTGLVVGGFLANMGMLKVDVKLNNWIKRNKKVALFKYVDDQTLMARSEKDLKTFYNFYKSLLEDSKAGVKFNYNKSEPKGRVNLKNGDWESKLPQEKSTINPKFPRQLMSFTIQKMSDINNKDYGLANDEEIREIERELSQFLATETTESELKKDTKLSFAALKLCQLVQNIQPDFGSIDIETTSSEHSELVYELKASTRKEIVTQIQSINNRYEGIFNILLNTAKEQPSKIRIWKRCVEFCLYTGFNGLSDLLSLINDSKIHKSSLSYIKAYVYYCIGECILKSYNTVKNSEERIWRIHCSYNFLDASNILIKDLCTNQNDNEYSKFSFEKNSLNNLLGLADVIFREDILIPNHLVFFGVKYSAIKKFKSSIVKSIKGSHLAYVIDRMENGLGLNIWNRDVSKISFKESCAEHLFLMFPKEKIFNKVNLAAKKYKWHNTELYKTWLLDSLENYPKKRNQIKIYQKSFNYRGKKYITLFEWMNWSRNINTTTLDPRITEWTVLEIVKQIAIDARLKLNKKDKTLRNLFKQNIKLYRIHALNYLIPIEWLELQDDKKFISWEDWYKIVATKKVKIRSESSLIYDPRYLPIKEFWGFEPNSLFVSEFPMVIGLGVLTSRILSKNSKWPNSSNKYNFIRSYSDSVSHLINSKMVSSGTIELLRGITSKKEFDFFFMFSENMTIESTKVMNLSTFILAIEKIQNKLKNFQISFNDKPPRQLIPIDIDNLNKFI